MDDLVKRLEAATVPVNSTAHKLYRQDEIEAISSPEARLLAGAVYVCFTMRAYSPPFNMETMLAGKSLIDLIIANFSPVDGKQDPGASQESSATSP